MVTISTANQIIWRKLLRWKLHSRRVKVSAETLRNRMRSIGHGSKQEDFQSNNIEADKISTVWTPRPLDRIVLTKVPITMGKDLALVFVAAC